MLDVQRRGREDERIRELMEEGFKQIAQCDCGRQEFFCHVRQPSRLCEKSIAWAGAMERTEKG